MKLSKMTAAIAATAMAASVQAETISGGDLNGVATDTAATHVSAVAVIASEDVLNGLRSMQGIGAACLGNVNALCAPSMSSAELRAILGSQIGNLNKVTGGGTDLGTASGIIGKAGNIVESAASGVLDALRAFNGSGVIGGFSCGQGNNVGIANSTANDAATIAAQTGPSFGFVHATELDGSTGFIKVDGVSPSLAALLSSNYGLVSNLNGAGAAVDKDTNGMTVGVASVAGGVASHSPVACSPLNTGLSAADVNGGQI